jgi:hypothetical protein
MQALGALAQAETETLVGNQNDVNEGADER